MELGEYFKDSWEEAKADVPLAHAELLSLEEFASKTGLPMDQIIEAFKAKGYQVGDEKQTLREIAKANGVSPAVLYEAVKAEGAKQKAQKYGSGSGMGRKSIKAVCAELGLPVDEAISRLEKKGISASSRDRFKDIASRAGKTPTDILNIIQGREQ